MAWLQIIRWKNLAIVLFTQLFAWYFIIYDFRTTGVNGYSLTPPYFFLLAAATVLITAAGYIINDYFDIKIDAINRPEKVVLINKIPLKMAIIVHTVLNVVALLMCFIVARSAGHYEWLLLQVGCTILLWFYSTHFKRQFVIGNLVVALLTALAILVPVIYEPAMYRYIYEPANILLSPGNYLLNPAWVSLAYCFFAFMLTWMREVVKDIEDHKGDAAEGCTTMPIKMGIGATVRFTQLLCGITIMVLAFLSWRLIAVQYFVLCAYTFLLLIIPLTIWGIFISRKNTTQHFHSASRYLKIIMTLGICSLIIYHLQTNYIPCTK